jgi:hypothetical protein
MSGSSLAWIDWRLAGRSMRREAAARFAAFFVLALCFLVLLFSGGTNRFLSTQWTVTAVLRAGVADEEGEGIAGKVSGLAPVRSAAYRTPEEAWEEFSTRYPGLGSLRAAGENPLPGYVEIRLRHDRLSQAGIDEVESALEPLPQVERLLSGGDAMPRLLRMKRWANAILWGGLGFLCALFLLQFLLQERGKAAALAPDFAFLEERGVPGRRIAASRAAGTAATAALLSVTATGAAAVALHLLSIRFGAVRAAVGSAEEFVDHGYLLPLALFLFLSAALPGAASLAGWRAAASPERR